MSIKYHSHIQLMDNNFLRVGTGGDFTIDHDGSHTSLQNSTGNLYIKNYADDSDIIFQSDDGSGGVTAYLTLDGSATAIKLAQHTSLADGKALYVGNSNDGAFYHSTNTFLTNATGDFTIVNYADDKDIIFQSDDGSGGVETYFYLDGGANVLRMSKDMYVPEYIYHQGDDNTKFGFSAADTFIVHTGGTTALTVDSSQNATFAGTITGTTLTGTSLDINGNADISGNLVITGNILNNVENNYLDIYGGNDTTNDAHIRLNGNANNWGSIEMNYGYDATNSFLKITQASSEHLRITNGGKIGVGVAAPASLLHVAGTVQVGIDDAGHDVKFFGDTTGVYTVSYTHLTLPTTPYV